jgi:hypothetical protein
LRACIYAFAALTNVIVIVTDARVMAGHARVETTHALAVARAKSLSRVTSHSFSLRFHDEKRHR